ncbi:MAG: Hsp20/alpha crystallin family protein [Bacteroidales bacterium]|nr:Hsp20/alpha crystallin family protein [Bacteroidales bacterium]
MLPVIKRGFNLPSNFDNFFDLLDDERGSIPAVNILETEDNFKIELAAPGFEKEDFKVDLDKNVLTISSEKEHKQEEKDEKFMRREFSYAKFSRSFNINDSIDGEKIHANHKNGILTVVLPKKEEAKAKPPKQITIS